MKKLFLLTALTLFSTQALANEPIITQIQASASKADGTRNFQVTVKHADTGWDHYADNFEILSADKKIIATRVLAHPHVNEQPFTREKYGVQIPHRATTIFVRAHDSVHGYGPLVEVTLPAPDQPIKWSK